MWGEWELGTGLALTIPREHRVLACGGSLSGTGRILSVVVAVVSSSSTWIYGGSSSWVGRVRRRRARGDLPGRVGAGDRRPAIY
ncbi:hypothetical protein Taro_055215 [Colocasia esculenta]|uniref:Uncharacterized protein n=1 Tax=Colocasia esculenta TaxID=4460 RepID=A0A843XTK7_COLES|nr:hypothetical protein [Colocasia esculenta]